MDRKPLNEDETQARAELAAALQAMLDRSLSFLEGAPRVLALRSAIGGVPDADEDFMAFVVIETETDHLPLRSVRHLWAETALAEVESEISSAETWAATFAPQACANLLHRFAPNNSFKPKPLRGSA